MKRVFFSLHSKSFFVSLAQVNLFRSSSHPHLLLVEHSKNLIRFHFSGHFGSTWGQHHPDARSSKGEREEDFFLSNVLRICSRKLNHHKQIIYFFQSDRSKLRIWCRIQAVFLILGVLSIFARVLNIWISFNTHPWYLLLTDLGSVLWIGYSLWTVQEFNNALKCTNVATDGRTDEENVHSRQKENKPKKYNDCLLYCCAALC